MLSRTVIFGGTGTLGQELTRQILKKSETQSVLIVSRDELKQVRMRKAFKDPRVSYRLGDIRDDRTCLHATRGATTVFHVAAIKHVDVAEANPWECVLTNVMGTKNILEACEDNNVGHAVLSSTDKAVDPINTYGGTKLLSEALFREWSPYSDGMHTKRRVYRWGNVLGSRGSVIHTFADALVAGDPITITDERMTRFWIRIQDAVDFMLRTYFEGSSLMIPPMMGASVIEILDSIARVLGVATYSKVTVGPRPGEKLHEAIVSQHDFLRTYQTSQTVGRYSADALDAMVKEVLMDDRRDGTAA